jgi:hypothetical protein
VIFADAVAAATRLSPVKTTTFGRPEEPLVAISRAGPFGKAKGAAGPHAAARMASVEGVRPSPTRRQSPACSISSAMTIRGKAGSIGNSGLPKIAAA